MRTMIDAWAHGDLDFVRDRLSPEVEFEDTARLDGDVRIGPDAVFAAMRTWVGTFEDYEFAVEKLVAAGDEVVILFRESGIGKGSRAPVETQAAALWTVEGGRVTRMRPFRDRTAGLRAAGLNPEEVLG